MENNLIKIEYKKFSSFLKDYIKTLGRGFLFLVSEEAHSVGEVFDFSIKVSGIDETLEAHGKVIYVGVNDSGEKGIGLEFGFNEVSESCLLSKLPDIVLNKYGNVWGEKLKSLLMDTREAL